MMNRREMLSIIMVAPAMARQALTEGKWLTIATPGWNRNNRRYAEPALASMADVLPGKWIIKRIDAALIPDDTDFMGLAVGVVARCRRNDSGAVQVQVEWLGGGAETVHGVLTPSGRSAEWAEVTRGCIEIRTYTPQCLELSEWSGFEGATQV